MPEAVFHDKTVCGVDNLRGGAIVLFDQKQSGPRMIAGKGHQRLRKSGAERVDALVLVPDHEKVFLPGGEQADDLMLDFGGVLCLIHTEITILLLKAVQNIRKPPQEREGVDHLVVIVHQAQAAKLRLIAAVELRKIGDGPLARFNLHLREHHVFDEGDGGADFTERGLFRVFIVDGLIKLTQNPAALTAFPEKGEGLAAKAGGGVGDELGRDAVDGTKLQSAG